MTDKEAANILFNVAHGTYLRFDLSDKQKRSIKEACGHAYTHFDRISDATPEEESN